MTEQQAIAYFHGLGRFGGPPGLDRMKRLMCLLGNPQEALAFVHVAGTNGKGSTCAMLASILGAAGYRTGLYTSPFILTFRERMQLDGELIPPDVLGRLAQRVKQAADLLAGEGTPVVEFEAVTATALLWYAESACDVVVWEVGLGGRWDATNIIATPLCSVLTPISLDHTQILGDTVEQIAGEKCGIIKAGGLTVTGPQTPDALGVIMERCALAGNPLVSGNPASATVHSMTLEGTKLSYGGLELALPLLGAYQVANCATAVEAARALNSRGLSVPDSAIVAGIGAAHIPARLELLRREPPVLLDGAHNPAGVEALAHSLALLEGRPLTAICGMLADKDWRASVGRIAPLFSHLVVVTPDVPRALAAGELADWAAQFCPQVEVAEDPLEAWRLADRDGQAVVVWGSLYLAAQMRPLVLEARKIVPLDRV